MTTSATATRASAAHLVFALFGMLLFGVALAAGAWLWIVQLGRDPSSAPAWAIPFDVMLFTVFAAHHSVMARSGAKAWLIRRVPAFLERSIYVWVASLLFLGMCAAWQPVPGVAWRLEGVAGIISMSLQVAGLALTLASVRLLDAGDLAGVRQVRLAMGGVLVHPHTATDEITRRGPYGWVRHPVYSGWLLMTFCSPLMTNGRLVFALVSGLYLVVAVPWEERSLTAEHAGYAAYQRDVRWRMVPGIY